MNKTFKKIIGAAIILLLLIIALLLTPSGAIRLYIAVHGYPLVAFRVSIHQGGYFKRNMWTDAYGWQFFVDGLNIRGNNVCFFYLNKNLFGIWSVTSVGTGH